MNGLPLRKLISFDPFMTFQSFFINFLDFFPSLCQNFSGLTFFFGWCNCMHPPAYIMQPFIMCVRAGMWGGGWGRVRGRGSEDGKAYLHTCAESSVLQFLATHYMGICPMESLLYTCPFSIQHVTYIVCVCAGMWGWGNGEGRGSRGSEDKQGLPTYLCWISCVTILSHTLHGYMSHGNSSIYTHWHLDPVQTELIA